MMYDEVERCRRAQEFQHRADAHDPFARRRCARRAAPAPPTRRCRIDSKPSVAHARDIRALPQPTSSPRRPTRSSSSTRFIRSVLRSEQRDAPRLGNLHVVRIGDVVEMGRAVGRRANADASATNSTPSATDTPAVARRTPRRSAPPPSSPKPCAASAPASDARRQGRRRAPASRRRRGCRRARTRRRRRPRSERRCRRCAPAARAPTAGSSQATRLVASAAFHVPQFAEALERRRAARVERRARASTMRTIARSASAPDRRDERQRSRTPSSTQAHHGSPCRAARPADTGDAATAPQDPAARSQTLTTSVVCTGTRRARG